MLTHRELVAQWKGRGDEPSECGHCGEVEIKAVCMGGSGIMHKVCKENSRDQRGLRVRGAVAVVSGSSRCVG